MLAVKAQLSEHLGRSENEGEISRIIESVERAWGDSWCGSCVSRLEKADDDGLSEEVVGETQHTRAKSTGWR